MTDAFERLTLTGAFKAAGQGKALVASDPLPSDLARAAVRIRARAVVAAQIFSAQLVPELTDRNLAKLTRI